MFYMNIYTITFRYYTAAFTVEFILAKGWIILGLVEYNLSKQDLLLQEISKG